MLAWPAWLVTHLRAVPITEVQNAALLRCRESIKAEHDGEREERRRVLIFR